MSAVHDPIMRKRLFSDVDSNASNGAETGGGTGAGAGAGAGAGSSSSETKKSKKDNDVSSLFSEKMYSAYVKSAFESLEKNDPIQINTLTSKINLPKSHHEAIPLSSFITVLKILISNISRLDNSYCSSLVSSILHYDWLLAKSSSEEEYLLFIELYAQFLSVLVSSLPKYLFEVTNKIIGEFIDLKLEGTALPHHKVLDKLRRFIPTCVNSFPTIIHKNFPHHLSTNSTELSQYVGNIMKMISYCPELQFNIWQMIIECCIKLDVELQNELDDLDDDEIEELINGNDDEEAEENEEDEEDEDDVIEGEVEYLMDQTTSTANIKSLVFKLDSVINLLLTNTKNSFTTEELNNGNGVTLFNTITSLFKSHILPTHFTKSIQFTLFHISQYQPELADSFLVLLIDIAFNPNEILEKRLKAMQYLSSYIARAKNLSRHQVVFIVSYLIGWLNKYVIEREAEVYDLDNNSDKSTGGMERFKLFYAAFQALLYIFCFRYKLLYKVDGSDEQQPKSSNDSEWECDLDKFFQRAILAKFNPLKFCDETVVYIFAKIATKLNVCYCYSIIEHNKRETMIQSNSSMPLSIGNFKLKQEFLDLEAYFPFDPIVLPNCKKIVNENYVEWSDVNPNDDEDDEDDSGVGSNKGDDDDDLDSDDEDSDEEITSDEDD